MTAVMKVVCIMLVPCLLMTSVLQVNPELAVTWLSAQFDFYSVALQDSAVYSNLRELQRSSYFVELFASRSISLEYRFYGNHCLTWDLLIREPQRLMFASTYIDQVLNFVTWQLVHD